MPIIFPEDPQAGQAKITPDLARVAPVKTARVFSFFTSRVPTLDGSRPHRVYTVGLSDLAAGKLLSAAKPIAWRYFVLASDGEVTGEMEFESAEEPTEGNATLKPRAITRGPFTDATVTALHAAETLHVVNEQPYEPRFLKIAAVYFAGLWLHGESRDLILPIANTPAGLEQNKPYSENQIIEILQPIARRNKEFHDLATG
jgi:hypothetical protein